MLERDKAAPAIPSWGIVDEQFMSRYMFSGTMPGSTKPQNWYESGFLKRADTVSDLARQIGVEPATLKATLERYNRFSQSRAELF